MQRFYIDPEQSREAVITLSERESHHALHVLRLSEGERVIGLDGRGAELICKIEHTGKHDARLRVQQRSSVPRLPFEITLIQAITKGKSMETIVQKAAELGAYRVAPILSERTVAHIDEESSRVEKWLWIAIDSIKQCGSAWLPRIDPPRKTAAFLASGERFDLTLLATLQADGRHPRVHLQAFQQEKSRMPKSVAVWVGPEGDFTPAEINSIRASGALPITLGPLVLRSETAAIYCLSVLNYELNSAAE